MSSFKPSRQPLIVVACCTIRNFFRKWTQNDIMFRQWEEGDFEVGDIEYTTSETSHTMNLFDEANNNYGSLSRSYFSTNVEYLC